MVTGFPGSGNDTDRVSSDVPGPDPGPEAEARLCTDSDVAAQYAQHHVGLRRVAMRVFDGKRPDAADQAVMEVFTKLLDLVRKGRLTDRGDSWGPYLRRAVHNSCISIIRKEKRDREHFPEGDPETERPIDLDPLGDALAHDDETRRRRERLTIAFAALSDRQTTIIVHAFWDEWSNKQIGEALGISGQAVGQQLKTILKKLHEGVTRDE
jgi:RNA polymerase sigma factor (sigma-70 family)